MCVWDWAPRYRLMIFPFLSACCVMGPRLYLLLCDMNHNWSFSSLKWALILGLDPTQTRAQVFESITQYHVDNSLQ